MIFFLVGDGWIHKPKNPISKLAKTNKSELFITDDKNLKITYRYRRRMGRK